MKGQASGGVALAAGCGHSRPSTCSYMFTPAPLARRSAVRATLPWAAWWVEEPVGIDRGRRAWWRGQAGEFGVAERGTPREARGKGSGSGGALPELKISLCGMLCPDGPRARLPRSAVRALMPRSMTRAKKVKAKYSPPYAFLYTSSCERAGAEGGRWRKRTGSGGRGSKAGDSWASVRAWNGPARLEDSKDREGEEDARRTDKELQLPWELQPVAAAELTQKRFVLFLDRHDGQCGLAHRRPRHLGPQPRSLGA